LNYRSGCLHGMHLLLSGAKQTNLELKTWSINFYVTANGQNLASRTKPWLSFEL
jgi:hypothetical protein